MTHTRAIIPAIGGDRTAQEPWPDGPLYRVDEAFRAACIETDALRKVMTNAPDLASEIILALLIEPRPPKMEYDYFPEHILPDDAVCLEDDNSFYPRFYSRGPFLLFLNINAEAALKTIIKLIDFATERWMECKYQEQYGRTGIDLLINGSIKRFKGDIEVYHWYHGIACSNIVSSVLMSVEKWLYERLDKQEKIDGWLNLILNTSQSVAFLGVLSEVGRYAPALFAGSLQSLILISETYYFEWLYSLQGGHSFGTPFSDNEGEWFFKLTREWDTMNHRRRSIFHAATYLFHCDRKVHEALLLARKQWSEISDKGDQK